MLGSILAWYKPKSERWVFILKENGGSVAKTDDLG